ncbi:MAG: formylmethanofuran dehydrogenase subunit A [Planctomycetota bacterium]
MLTQIRGCRIIDPAAREADSTGDLWIRDEHLQDAPIGDEQPDRIIDAQDCVAMAGGIDLHTHIGGGKLTLARLLLGDQMPPWRGARPHTSEDPAESEFLPSASVTAQRYLDMGYTTCFEPAMIPCNARSAHAEMADVRGIDTGGYCLLGNDDVLLSLIADGAEQAIINQYVAWMVAATRSIAVKVVNPGGIHAFKYNARAFDVDTPHPRFSITPGQIVRTLCRAVHEIGLVHPLHVHCSNLGVPGNIESTLATIRAADGYPIHLTHVQFHCYGSDGPHRISSAAEALVSAMNQHRHVTVDIGQVQFGRTVTISADAMHQMENSAFAKPRKSILVDIECEAGCGVVPFRYKQTQLVHCLQWAIGLELLLMIDDPSRVFLTTDHPNGGPFTAYPHLIRLLTDRSFRETAIAEIHPDAAASSSLVGIQREYTLPEIATMTRLAPARILGLTDRGHLQPGGVADVALYTQQADHDRMFAHPRMVLKRGSSVRDHQTSRNAVAAADQTLTAAVDFDPSRLPDFRARYSRHGSFEMDRLWIGDQEMSVIGSEVNAFPMAGRS